MRNEDIEILDDFSDNLPNQNSQIINPSMIQPPQYNNPMPNYNLSPQPEPQPQPSYDSAPQDFNQNASVNEFEKMMTEAPDAEPTPEPEQPMPTNQIDYANDYANYQNNNNFNNLSYANDSNNDLVQSNDYDDLTITAVYPNGFVVPDQEEQVVENRVVKPKKSSGDLFLIIIVAVLAITLVVMLVIFYI